jgi:hypothetical protein
LRWTPKRYDEILRETDALQVESLRARHAGMAGEGKTQRPVYSVLDTDAGCDNDIGDDKSVIANLERGNTPGDIESVVAEAREAEGLAEAAGSGGEQARSGVLWKAAIGSHAREAGYRFERTDKDAARKALDLATDVHAVITAVDGVNIGVPGRTEEDEVARGGTAMRVGGWIGRDVVGAEVGFDFDDSSGYDATGFAVREHFAEETRGYDFRAGFEEGAGKQTAGYCMLRVCSG